MLPAPEKQCLARAGLVNKGQGMAILHWNAAQGVQRPDVSPSCGGWVESSFELHQGVEVLEDIGFEEFERLSAQEPLPPALITRSRD